MIEMPIRPQLNLQSLLRICDNAIDGALTVLGDPDYQYEDDILHHALQTLAKATECAQALMAVQADYEEKLAHIMREVRDIACEIDQI